MGWPAKNDKTKNSRFCDLRIVGYKKITKQKFRVSKIYLPYEISFLVPYNSQIKNLEFLLLSF